MGNTVLLECFDDPAESAFVETQDYKLGFVDGKAEALADIEARFALNVAELSSTLNDMAFGYAEARQTLLARIAPLLMQISDLVVPQILKATFEEHLKDTLLQAFEEACPPELQVLVSPENAQRLAQEGLGATHSFKIRPRTDLSDGQAVIGHEQSNTLLDLEALAESLSLALNGIDNFERRQKDG